MDFFDAAGRAPWHSDYLNSNKAIQGRLDASRGRTEAAKFQASPEYKNPAAVAKQESTADFIAGSDKRIDALRASEFKPYAPSPSVPNIDRTQSALAAPSRALPAPKPIYGEGINKSKDANGQTVYSGTQGPAPTTNQAPSPFMDQLKLAGMQMDNATNAVDFARAKQRFDAYISGNQMGDNRYATDARSGDNRYSTDAQQAIAALNNDSQMERQQNQQNFDRPTKEAQAKLFGAQAGNAALQGGLATDQAIQSRSKLGLDGMRELYSSVLTSLADMDQKSPEYASRLAYANTLQKRLSDEYSIMAGGVEGKAEGGMIGAMGPQAAPQQNPVAQKYGQYVQSAMQAGVQPLPMDKFVNLLTRTHMQMQQAAAQQAQSAMPQNPGSGAQMGFAEGGAINVDGRQVLGPGTGKSDSIPAVIDGKRPAALSTGEFVFPVEAVQFFGMDRLNKMVAAARKGSSPEQG